MITFDVMAFDLPTPLSKIVYLGSGCLSAKSYYSFRYPFSTYQRRVNICPYTKFTQPKENKLIKSNFTNCISHRFQWDEVVLSKTVLSNFHPKQAKEWIGGQMASLFWLFIACLTWPNLTGSNRPLSLFFHHPTLPGYRIFCCLFSEIQKMEIKRSGYQLLNFLLLA